jgi:HAE1 family hydrophobic/amphiphilic exporter-1
VRRPVFATVLILVDGHRVLVHAPGRRPFPKVDFPTVVITTFQPGAAPEQIETEVTDKIEEAVNTISGTDELRSTSSEGVSVVFVSFLLERALTSPPRRFATRSTASCRSSRARLSSRASTRWIRCGTHPQSSVASKRPVRDVTEFADSVLRRQLESVSGVGQVLVLGGRQRQVNLWLDANRLRQHNLTVTDVSRALQAQNLEIPGGRVDQARSR